MSPSGAKQPLRDIPRRGLATSDNPVSAIAWNPDLARKYRQRCKTGKPPKVAITAIMRKLLLLANALIAQDRTWTDTPPTCA